MIDLFRTSISEEDMIRLFRVLYEKALKGDVSAAKLVLAYHIGKPSACPDPDSVDRDEWEHYQQDAIEPQEMKLVLSSLPARVGNDIVRAALPVITEARTAQLAAQMGSNAKGTPEVTRKTEEESDSGMRTSPKANVDFERSIPEHLGTTHSQPSSTSQPNSACERQAPTAPATQRSKKLRKKLAANSRRKGNAGSNAAPLPIGNSEERTAGKQNRKKRGAQWLHDVAQQIAGD
jgi:hypothetical protein